MNKQFDALTVALTGQLTMVLIVAAVFSLVLSLFLLWRYRRAVIKSMRRHGRTDLLDQKGFLQQYEAHKPPDEELVFTFAGAEGLDAAASKKNPLYRQARRRPWLAAFVYAIAGTCFAAIMAVAFLLSAKMAFLPLRLSYLTWANAWPVLLTTNLVAVTSRRGRLILLAGYFLCGLVFGVLLLDRSPDLTVAQLAYLWLNVSMIPSLLLLFFLNRRIRAVGPLVLVFMIFGAAGALILTSVASSHPKLLRAISDFTYSLGVSPTATFWGLQVLGFTVFAIAGWIVVDSLRQMYERKMISDQSVTIDTIWLLFGIVNSMDLVFEGPRWILSGFVAFTLFKIVVALGFRIINLGKSLDGRRVLILRVFALGRRSEQIYDALGKSWRSVGSIQMIAGPDLATTTVEPHEFLDFIAGRLARRFIDSGQALDLRILQMDLASDGDGRFRVSEFFCHDDTWKITLSRLADESDAVLMDLRGFTQANAGCVFEIHELFNSVALERIVFVIDDSTDQDFARQTMEQAWRQIKDRSPNRRPSAGRVTLAQLNSQNAFKDLLYSLCAAASGLVARAPATSRS
jgi:hypothetical protein